MTSPPASSVAVPTSAVSRACSSGWGSSSSLAFFSEERDDLEGEPGADMVQRAARERWTGETDGRRRTCSAV